MRWTDGLLALAVTLCWGINFVVAKVGLEQLPPLLFMCLRFVVVALVLVPFFRLPRQNVRAVLILAVTLGFTHFSLMFTGLQYVDAAVAAIVIQIQVPFAAILSAVFFRDPPGWRRTLGMIVAIAGVVLLAGAPRPGSELWAIGLIVAAALVWAIANMQMTRLANVNGFAVNGWMALFAIPMLGTASLILEDDQLAIITQVDWSAWGAVLYQAILVVIVGYGVWLRLLGRYGVAHMMGFTLLVPLFGVASGIALLGEPLTWDLIFGGVLTIAGVAIIVLRRPRLVERQEIRT